MSGLRAADLVVVAFYVISAILLVWDIVLAGQIAQLRRAPVAFRTLTALAGLLIAPAALVAVASASVLDGRAIHVIAWVWPATLLLFAAQAIYASSRRLVTAFLGVPIAIYDILLAAAAVARYAAYEGMPLASWGMAFSAAQASALGVVVGRAALFSPLAIQIPLLAPAYPARWRITKTLRGFIALAAAAWSVLLALELPTGYMAVTSYRRYAAERLRERPRGDFAVGLRIFPALRDVPPPLAMRYDLALLDSLDVRAISVVVDPDGADALALDSLRNVVEGARRDSVPLIVALGYSPGERARFREAPTRLLQERVRVVERIARRLRPDILIPAVDPYTAGMRALGPVPTTWWQEYVRLSARATHGVSRRIQVGLAASAFDPRDSVLYHWAASPGSGVDALGFSLYPSYGGGAALDARMRVAERWMRRTRRDHWVFGAGGYPTTHGEESQERALWGVLAWATGQPRIKGLVIDGASDYDRTTGLRAPGGRLRQAAATVARAIGIIEETRGS